MMERIKYVLADVAVIYVFVTSVLFHIAIIAYAVKWMSVIQQAIK
jgi:hypothetical protein